MKDEEFGRKIKELLDSSLSVDESIAARLRAGRERALAAARPVTVASAELATAGGLQVQSGASRLLTRVILPVAILLAAAFGWQHWQQTSATSAEVQEYGAVYGAIDAEVLKSDIPIDALLDRDFHAYLKKVSRREE